MAIFARSGLHHEVVGVIAAVFNVTQGYSGNKSQLDELWGICAQDFQIRQDEATHSLPMFAMGFSYPSSDVKPGCEGLINSPMSKLWTVPGH